MTAFLSLLGVAVAISGTLAYIFFWSMALVHLNDRHPDARAQLGPAAFLAPTAMLWLLGGRYRALDDRALSGLATPARLALLAILAGLVFAAVMAIISPEL